MATPNFRVKRASSSQDTVDYIVQKRIVSLGNPERIVWVSSFPFPISYFLVPPFRAARYGVSNGYW